MADVFLAEDERRGTRLVLKQLRADTPELLVAFRSEFALLAGLLHPRLAQVHDFGSCRVRGESYHYYTAAYIEGSTLRMAAREGATREAEAARQPAQAQSSPDAPRGEHDPAWLRAFTDALEGLAALHELKWLGLAKTKVSGPGMEHLANLPKLETLRLEDTKLDDAGLQHLADGPLSLRNLSLRNTDIGDAGIANLRKLKKIESLESGGTRVTSAGREALLEHLTFLPE